MGVLSYNVTHGSRHFTTQVVVWMGFRVLSQCDSHENLIFVGHYSKFSHPPMQLRPCISRPVAASCVTVFAEYCLPGIGYVYQNCGNVSRRGGHKANETVFFVRRLRRLSQLSCKWLHNPVALGHATARGEFCTGRGGPTFSCKTQAFCAYTFRARSGITVARRDRSRAKRGEFTHVPARLRRLPWTIDLSKSGSSCPRSIVYFCSDVKRRRRRSRRA